MSKWIKTLWLLVYGLSGPPYVAMPSHRCRGFPSQSRAHPRTMLFFVLLLWLLSSIQSRQLCLLPLKSPPDLMLLWFIHAIRFFYWASTLHQSLALGKLLQQEKKIIFCKAPIMCWAVSGAHNIHSLCTLFLLNLTAAPPGDFSQDTDLTCLQRSGVI